MTEVLNKNGTPRQKMGPKPVPIERRLWSRVDKSGHCWIWNGHVTNKYGSIRHDGRTQRVHRVAYELLRGPIPEGLVLDHLCRNTLCVNPDHLEPVTGRENILRGVSHAAINAKKTHCKNGHPFDESNTGSQPGGRLCLACKKQRQTALDKARWQREKGRRNA